MRFLGAVGFLGSMGFLGAVGSLSGKSLLPAVLGGYGRCTSCRRAEVLCDFSQREIFIFRCP